MPLGATQSQWESMQRMQGGKCESSGWGHAPLMMDTVSVEPAADVCWTQAQLSTFRRT